MIGVDYMFVVIISYRQVNMNYDSEYVKVLETYNFFTAVESACRSFKFFMRDREMPEIKKLECYPVTDD